jgi:hypothetical protein
MVEGVESIAQTVKNYVDIFGTVTITHLGIAGTGLEVEVSKIMPRPATPLG